MHIAIWNIRGFNKSSKHKIVRQFIQDYNLSLLGLLETKIPGSKLQSLTMKITKDWKWICNVHEAGNGRIWLLWDSDILTMQDTILTDQYITCWIESRDGKFSSLCTIVYAHNQMTSRRILWSDLLTFCTIVYAHNQMTSRRILWSDLLTFKNNVTGPWVIGGDFNAITSYDEKIGGVSVSESDIEDFQNFIISSHLLHLKSTGCYFTWNNKQNADTRIWSRLDRCLVNEDWIHLYTTSQVEYLLPSCSDHSPALLTIEDDIITGKRPFKFFNMWVKHPDFMSTVKAIWEQNIDGFKMYSFHSKLKMLKTALKDLNKKHYMNISEQVLRAKNSLTEVQGLLSGDLFNPDLIRREKDCIKKYERLLDCESSFYKQKANIDWCLDGDKGTKFFHSIMKKKRHQNRIISLYTENGIRITDSADIVTEIVDYYKNYWGLQFKQFILIQWLLQMALFYLLIKVMS
ncbi:uncharacterized protein LOC109839326 [Asparagus officinalis]|uniref:uncharacterized protein LOC109839326 n=1 Tax=Asparagus officinalis TaxID=4686 RepID=UPI00098E5F29|nr:uncharacterized protein LOC109839326 [Asparagus officinalis]